MRGAIDAAGYIEDWSAVPLSQYRLAQEHERAYWSERDPSLLRLRAEYYFAAGSDELTRGRLIDPFGVQPAAPENFQITVEEMTDARVLDIGCGPDPSTLSLVQCATVRVVDPLIDLYQEIQPWGWDSFEAVVSGGAEDLPFDDASFDFVHCRNTLDHARDAAAIVREVVRVLRPDGQLLLRCDVRGPGSPPGGPAHPYRWTVDTLEAGLFASFDVVGRITLLDEQRSPVPRDVADDHRLIWCGRLRTRSRHAG